MSCGSTKKSEGILDLGTTGGKQLNIIVSRSRTTDEHHSKKQKPEETKSKKQKRVAISCSFSALARLHTRSNLRG
jgi:hypothetical protein